MKPCICNPKEKSLLMNTSLRSGEKSEITIGLLWHSFSSDNLGVGALSESQIAICEAAATKAGLSLRYIVFGTKGARSYLPSGRNIRQGSHLSLKQLITGRSPFWRELDQCDTVLDIGEGDSFADIYGKGRFRLQIASKIAVILKKKPLILSPQTIGPFESFFARIVARLVMSHCTAIIARDNLSFKYLKSMGVTRAVFEAIDVAFRLPYTKADSYVGGKTRVGLNVSGLLYSGGYKGTNQFGLTLDYPALINSLIQHWSSDDSIEIWLIPHVLADDMPRDDDQVAIRQLKATYPNLRVAPNFKSPSEAKSFISGLDFLSGARMHACIAAFSSGVPVVPMAYSRKFNGLFSSLGYEWLADGKRMTTDQAKACILAGFEKRKELSLAIAQSAQVVEKKLQLYEDCLISLFERLRLSK